MTINRRGAVFEGTLKGGPLILSHIFPVLQTNIKGPTARATCAKPCLAPFKVLSQQIKADV